MIEVQDESRVSSGRETIEQSGRSLYDAAYGHLKITPREIQHGDDLSERSLQLPANRSPDGMDLKLRMTDSGIRRAVTVHLPPGYDPSRPTSMYYLLDGVQINNPSGNMAGINGWNATADEFQKKSPNRQIVTVSIGQAKESAAEIYGVSIPSSILGMQIPQLSSWNFDHGFLNKKPGFHDVDFVSKVVERMQKTAKVDENYLVGFSDGGLLAHDVAATMKPGSINGVATIASTMLRDSKLMPPPGVRGIFINMKDDPTVPLAGGPGPKLSKYLDWAGHSNILNSVPLMQESRYAEANGIRTGPKITEGAVAQSREYFVSQDDAAKVKAFTIKKPGAGHTYPGRATGEGTSTGFTKANGDTVSHTEFPANEIIVRFFEDGRKIQRRL